MYQCQVRVFGAGEKFGVFAAAAFVGLEDPEEEGVASEEVGVEALAVAGPELTAAQTAVQGAPPKLPEDTGQGVVELDDGVGPRPGDVAGAAVVAVDDPAVSAGGPVDEGAEIFVGAHGPVRTPVEGVEFGVREVEFLGNTAGHGGFAGAGGADDEEAMEGRGSWWLVGLGLHEEILAQQWTTR